jgi:hypothetical protein
MLEEAPASKSDSQQNYPDSQTDQNAFHTYGERPRTEPLATCEVNPDVIGKLPASRFEIGIGSSDALEGVWFLIVFIL